MRFVIKAGGNDLNNLLETNQYKRLWRQHARQILRAFRGYTGLDFQQRVITARVRPERQSHSGHYHEAMQLAGDNRNEDYKLMTMIHELAHRLLGGNMLDVYSLGLVTESDTGQDELKSELEHRFIYIFLYDMMAEYFGEAMAEKYRQYECRYDYDCPHQRAWYWAMSLTPEQRLYATKRLAGYAVMRDKWDDCPRSQKQDYTRWFDDLVGNKAIMQVSKV